MNHGRIIESTTTYAHENLGSEGSGHDWWHVWRVRNSALKIGKAEGADLFVVELAALLHDIADWKFHDGDETAGSRVASTWLESHQVDEDIIRHVCSIIDDLSFKGAGVKSTMPTLEGMVVQDADRLDAMGAIGIARTFAYGGHKGREMYNPEVKPERHETFEQYKASTGPTINHFYEKLLLLKGLMNTQTAKEMAEGRHQYMKEFLERFYQEWRGEN